MLLNNKEENTLLQIIRYGPIFFILLLSSIITFYLSIEHSSNLNENKVNIRNEYIDANKEKIKTSIETSINKYIQREFKNAEIELRKDLKYKLNIVYDIALNIYKKNKDILSKDEITRHIKNTIESFRFDDGDGYFFIYDLEGTNIIHPIKPQREGRNFFHAKDKNGTFIIQESINIAKSKEQEGYQKWFFNKPNDFLNEYEKLGFIKKFEPYNWFIGTGTYIEDFENIIKNKILNHLSYVKYENDGYIFVVDYKGNSLVSKDRKLDGINILKSTNLSESAKNKFKDFINSNDNARFIEYKFKEIDQQEHLKISYFKKIDSLSWVIALGFDLEETNSIINKEHEKLQEDYKNKIISLLLISVLVTVFLLFISYFISNFLQEKFLDYEKALFEKEKIKFESIIKELRVIFDNLPMMLIYKDIENNILTVNKHVLDSLGKSIDELSNVPSKNIFPNDYEKYYEDDLEVIKTKKAKVCFIERFESKNGFKTIESTKVPIFDDDGNVSNIMLFMIDITEKEKLKKENDTQQHILYQQSKFATMGEMIANIAHQWRQPLSTISTASTGASLQKQIGCLNDKEFFSAMDAINNSAQYLSQIIEDFRNFFKPDKNTFEEFSILKILNKTFNLLEAKLASQSIEITKDIEDIKIFTVENGLVQILMNIITNARDELIKYNHRRLIFIRTYKKENNLLIEIKDNAHGIPENIVDKVFDPYFTTKSDSLGTGIGLHMSKDIVIKLLNGEIMVENETFVYENIEYTGAKFTIKLEILDANL